MTERIGFTKVKLPYGWLGNMSPHPINMGMVEWRSSEALFQAMRFNDEEIREKIRLEKSPFSAKLVAKANRDKMAIVPCSTEDVANMKTCLQLKLACNPDLRTALKSTGNAILFEDVTARGSRGSNLFWGAMVIDDSLVGENVLGKIWMEIRDLSL